jgi:hypothetical protein
MSIVGCQAERANPQRSSKRRYLEDTHNWGFISSKEDRSPDSSTRGSKSLQFQPCAGSRRAGALRGPDRHCLASHKIMRPRTSESSPNSDPTTAQPQHLILLQQCPELSTDTINQSLSHEVHIQRLFWFPLSAFSVRGKLKRHVPSSTVIFRDSSTFRKTSQDHPSTLFLHIIAPLYYSISCLNWPFLPIPCKDGDDTSPQD